ncbi:MAG: sulfotransferase family 2 domain-containing protein [Pseudomonadota bacterium]
MRTGSNFLEANLNAMDGITCHGEAFNPHFLGYPGQAEILGVTQDMRDGDPKRLLREIKRQPGALGGFRYFHDHDPRILDKCLDDPRCAKIVLTRNPLDSYVSWKIAQETGQWKLTDAKSRKDGRATFDAGEFEAHVQALQDFQVTLLNRLQTSGQAAFYIAYEDLQSVEVMNGLARYLGVAPSLEALDKNLKKQNPSPITDKVRNVDEMSGALAALDQFNLTRTPNFEPRRGPAVPTYVTAAKAPLLYLPVKAGPRDAVLEWMAALDGVQPSELGHRPSQNALRKWMRQAKGHRSFTVLRHPVARAHHAFCKHILGTGPDSFEALRATMIRRYKLPIPADAPDAGYDLQAHRAAFAAFLTFLKGNLAGQTAIRVDGAWCSQAQSIAGFAEFVPPDMVIREERMAEDLPALAAQIGIEAPAVPDSAPDTPFALAQIYDAEIEALARDVYARDYLLFGFGNWG